jgi:hypothetical protein
VEGRALPALRVFWTGSPETTPHMCRRLAVSAAVVVLAACGGDNEDAAQTQASTQPLPQAWQVGLGRNTSKSRLTEAEVAWVRKLRRALVEISGDARRLELLVGDRTLARKALEDARVAGPFRVAIANLSRCTARLDPLAKPPTQRATAGLKVLREACRHLETVARDGRRFFASREATKLSFSDVDLGLAIGQVDRAVIVLLPRSEGQKLPSIDEPSSKSRIQPTYSKAAEAIVGVGIEVRCWSKADWRRAKRDAQQLTGEKVVDRVAGFVLSGYRANLSPPVCRALDAFAYDDARPKTGEAFAELVDALVILAHESQHAAGVFGEPEAECYGMQLSREAALELGATKAYADGVADAAWATRYPSLPALYRSVECRDGGELDLFPETSLWP